MKPPALVVLHPAAARAYGLRPGSRFPVAAVVITGDGTELIVQADGQVEAPPHAAPLESPKLGGRAVPGDAVTAAYVEIMRLLIAQRAAK